MNNIQKQTSYGDLHNKKKYSAGDKDSYIHFLEEQLKKLTDSLIDNENIKERLEAIESKVERMNEKTDKMQKINKLLQTCVDNQEEDLKTFKNQIYVDFDMKCKVIESKFDVDDKILNQESNLNKKFNQRQRDFDKIVDNFEKKIQINYDEFSSEIAIDLKQVENKVEDRISQIKDDVLFWVKEELDNQKRDKQLYSHFQEFRCNISEQFDLQKTELNAYFEVLNTKTKAQFNDFIEKIEERLQHQEQVEQHPGREDYTEKQKYRKDVQDLKYITNLIMEKVEKQILSLQIFSPINKQTNIPLKRLEDNRENNYQRQSSEQKLHRNSSIDKVEKKIVNQMSCQFEKLSNIIKQLQDQQFSIEKKIMNIDPRNYYDNIKITSKQDQKKDNAVDERLQYTQTLKQTPNNLSQEINQRKSSLDQCTLQGDKNAQLGDKYSLISDRLKQRKLQEEDELNYHNYSQKENDKNQINKKQIIKEESYKNSPKHINKKYDLERSQNTDSLNQSLDDLLSKRNNILFEKPPTKIQSLNSPQSTQYGFEKNSYKQSLQSSQEKVPRYSSQIEKDSLNLNQNKEISYKQNENNIKNVSKNYQTPNQRQNVLEQTNSNSINQLSNPPQVDSFKRRSSDDRSMLNTIPKLVNRQDEQKFHTKTEEYEQNKPQSRIQKSNSLNRFEEIQQHNIQNSPTNQIDDNLADHLEQRRERLRKFIEQTEQQLEEANNGFEEKINKKYETMKDLQKGATSCVGEQKSKSIKNNDNEKKFSPFSSQKNQYKGEVFNKKYIESDMSATFDDKQSFQNSDMKQSYGNKYEENDEFNDIIHSNNLKTTQYSKNNQIYNAGDDSDIIRLNHRIMTAENNTMDSFSRDILPSRSLSRENVQKLNNQNVKFTQDEKIMKYDSKDSYMNKQQIKTMNQDQKRGVKIDSDSDDEEIQKVLQKYNNTKVNIKDLIEKKKEEEQLQKKQQPNKEKIISPPTKNPYTERDIPASKISNNTSSQKTEYYEVGDKTRDLLRDDDTFFDISASNINQSEMINFSKQDKPLKQENKQTKTNNNQKKPEIQNRKQNQESVKSTKSSIQTEPSSHSKNDIESFFYTKGLKYDFNFSNNTSKTKDQSKSFSMIDKVMNASQKQKK